MNHSWHQLSIATPGSGRARTRSGLAICEPAISEPPAHVLRSGLPPTSTATLSATGPCRTLRPVNNPAAGVAQRTRTGRHFSGMTRRDLGDHEKLSKLQLGKQNSESVSLLVRVGEGRKSPWLGVAGRAIYQR